MANKKLARLPTIAKRIFVSCSIVQARLVSGVITKSDTQKWTFTHWLHKDNDLSAVS